MPYRVECPICEFAVEIEPNAKSAACQHCGQSFNPQTAIVLETTTKSPAPRPEPAEIIPTPNVPAKPAIDPITAKLLETKKRIAVWRAVFFGFTCLLTLAITIGGYLYLKFKPQEERRVDPVAQEERLRSMIDSPELITATSTEFTTANQTAAPPKRQERPKLPLKPIQNTSLNHFTRDDIDTAWRKVYGSVFLLEITRGESVTRALGVLVDSRGWVATSFRAVQGADKVVVRDVPSDTLYELPDSSLIDSARGVLAHDETKDIALIQINRRQVNVINALEMKLTTPVYGLYTMLAHFPGDDGGIDRFGWLVESRTDQGDTPEKFESNLSKSAREHNLDPEVRWFTSLCTTPFTPGAPVFDDEGKIAGIASSISAGPRVVVVPAAAIKDLMGTANDTTVSFASLAPTTSSTATSHTSNLTTVPDDAPQLASDHEFGQMSHRLNLVGAECDAFGWIYEDAKQFEKLLEYFRQAAQVKLTIEDDSGLDFRSLDILDAQTQFWDDRLIAAFHQLDTDARDRFNDLSRQQGLGSNGAGVLTVKVELQALIGSDTTYLRSTDSSEKYFAVANDPDRVVMNTGSQWLVVIAGIGDKARKFEMREPEERKFLYRDATLYYFIKM
ncbi:MAG: serine protease [Pirellulaceae bacterium]